MTDELRDPWWFARWAYNTPVGNSNRKAVLVALAIMADSNTGRCEAKIARIAKYTELGERSVSTHLRALAEGGVIARRPQFRADGGRRGDEFLLLPEGTTEWPDGTPVQNLRGGGEADGTTPPSSVAGQEQPLVDDHASRQGQGAREAVDEFPEDLPEALHEVAIQAGKILKATAIKRQQRKPVTRAAVGHAVLTYPDRDHVAVAREVEGWMLHGRGARKGCADIVARYRNFLSNADPMPGPPLPGAPNGGGRPSGGPGTISSQDLRQMAEHLREQDDR